MIPGRPLQWAAVLLAVMALEVAVLELRAPGSVQRSARRLAIRMGHAPLPTALIALEVALERRAPGSVQRSARRLAARIGPAFLPTAAVAIELTFERRALSSIQGSGDTLAVKIRLRGLARMRGHHLSADVRLPADSAAWTPPVGPLTLAASTHQHSEVVKERLAWLHEVCEREVRRELLTAQENSELSGEPEDGELTTFLAFLPPF